MFANCSMDHRKQLMKSHKSSYLAQRLARYSFRFTRLAGFHIFAMFVGFLYQTFVGLDLGKALASVNTVTYCRVFDCKPSQGYCDRHA